MKNCFDPRCKAAPVKTLRGLKMCLGHYIEALEHSAHLAFGSWNGKDAEIHDFKTTHGILKELKDARKT